jgi:uncharacterized protein YebE (UPF0316 family)
MLALFLSALFIFFLRLIDVSLGTLRMLMTMRGRKPQAWVLGFFQALVFVFAIQAVIANLDNWLNLVGYASGFATGNVLGMWLEERIALGYTHLNVISPRRGAQIAEHLREAGYAVTEIPARGKDGTVMMLNCSIYRKNVDKVMNMIAEVDADAMITAEEIRPVRKGYWVI